MKIKSLRSKDSSRLRRLDGFFVGDALGGVDFWVNIFFLSYNCGLQLGSDIIDSPIFVL